MALTQRNWLNDEAPAIDDTYLNELDDEVRRIANEVADIEFPLTDSISTTDSTIGASATAVKTAYDLADSKQDDFAYTADSANYTIASGSGKTLTATSLSKVFQAEMPFGGTVKVYFTLTTTNSNFDAYGQIYVNGVAVGTLRGRTSYGTSSFNENVTIEKGDNIQVYARVTSYNSGSPASISSISVRSDIAFEPIVTNY